MPIQSARGVQIHRPVAVTTESPNPSDEIPGGPEVDPESVLGADDSNSPENDLRDVVYSEGGDNTDTPQDDDDELDDDALDTLDGSEELSAAEDGEEEKLRNLILAFLDVVTEPTDDQFHDLARSVGIDHEDLERIAYKLLGELSEEAGFSEQSYVEDPALSPAVEDIDDSDILVEDF